MKRTSIQSIILAITTILAFHICFSAGEAHARDRYSSEARNSERRVRVYEGERRRERRKSYYSRSYRSSYHLRDRRSGGQDMFLLEAQYSSMSKSYLPVFINVFLPFSIGSFVSGDLLMGGITGGAQLLGLFMLPVNPFLGATLFTLGYFAGIVSHPIYVYNYNRKLRESLYSRRRPYSKRLHRDPFLPRAHTFSTSFSF